MNKLIELIKNINNVRYELKDNILTIYNLDNDNKIEIIEDSYDEYIVSFATQHCHFDNDYEDIVDYINEIINDKSFSIEFFLNEEDIFGGELSIDEYNNISVDSLAKHFMCDEEYILDFSYEIHSWSGRYDVKRVPVSSLKDKNNE